MAKITVGLAIGKSGLLISSTIYPKQKVPKNAEFLIYFNTFESIMDIQFWIWLIVIVITLIARANKKKAKPFETNQSDDLPSLPETKPISFEDLLREIQAAKAPKPVKQPIPNLHLPKQYDFVDYDDNLKDEVEEFERVDYKSQDQIYDTYEKAKRDAFNRPSLEETIKVGGYRYKLWAV
jgi:hypothetical protein